MKMSRAIEISPIEVMALKKLALINGALAKTLTGTAAREQTALLSVLVQVVHRCEVASAIEDAEEKLTVEQAWTILCETPDITSPEEYPDHALITIEQLGSFMDRAAISKATA
jgi:hypothetical protein